MASFLHFIFVFTGLSGSLWFGAQLSEYFLLSHRSHSLCDSALSC
jgi:hypothetical protein